jgi:hypothetical protein
MGDWNWEREDKDICWHVKEGGARKRPIGEKK